MTSERTSGTPAAAVPPESAAEPLLPRISPQSLIGPDGIGGPERFTDLLHAATRQCRRLVDCETVRIWVARSGGRRLVAHEFANGGAPSRELRQNRGEGLAGYVMTSGAALRLGPEDPRPPGLESGGEPGRSALVLPLYRRGEPFGAIECLGKRGGEFTAADFDRLEVAAESVSFALDYALLSQEIERRALEKNVLLEVTRALAMPFELEDVVAAILVSLRQVVDYDAAAIYLVTRNTATLEMVSAQGYPEGSESAFDLQIGQGIVGWVAKSGQSVIVPDVRKDSRYVAARHTTRSEIATPMMFEGRVTGVFNLESDHLDVYHDGHLELLAAFAVQAAMAVERARTARERVEARRLEKELAIARDIQRSFLPASAPRVPGFDLAGTSISHAQVGGDYYDFIAVSDTRLGLAIADVSGKGIPAALLMAGFRMSLLAEIRNEYAIRAVMRKVNHLLHESTERDRFVTAFYGVLDWRNGVLIFSNAGHNPPLLLRADGTTEELSDGGVALGVLEDTQYEERPLALADGDVVVLYTDGVSEAEDEHGEQFGPARIERLVRSHPEHNARELTQDIVAAVLDWAGEGGLGDDLTLLVMRKLAARA
ncbi:MAG TPA: GAF domain-containing SpoIIE family protein phosphatase [Candidatus Eisenbacteria bacterium]